jgi:predicted CDP-diglyceride synthetase/phosphatidate cytidylyltransferase
MAPPEKDYAAQIAGARRTARRVAIAAAISGGSGWAVIAACVLAWLAFGVSILDSLEIMLAIGVAGILGGVGLYAQSRNLDLSASRLEIALNPQES